MNNINQKLFQHAKIDWNQFDNWRTSKDINRESSRIVIVKRFELNQFFIIFEQNIFDDFDENLYDNIVFTKVLKYYISTKKG